MPTEPQEPTLFEVVHRAVEVCDPAGANDGLGQLLERFQDRDEPVTGVADIDMVVAEAKGAIDPQDEDPAVVMAAAVAVYLAHRRTELARDREEILRLATRAEFDGQPPELLSKWLEAEGVEI